MNLKRYVVAFLATGLMASGAWAAAPLSAGQYVSNLSPNVDEKTADQIEKNLGQIQELRMVDVKPDTSSLHFTVKENSQVDPDRISSAVQAAAPGTKVGDAVAAPKY